jgi:hypothetical protein
MQASGLPHRRTDVTRIARGIGMATLDFARRICHRSIFLRAQAAARATGPECACRLSSVMVADVIAAAGRATRSHCR